MGKFRTCRPDLVLMDYHLPKINGVKGVEMLRREDPEVPLIVFTIEDNQRVADPSSWMRGRATSCLSR